MELILEVIDQDQIDLNLKEFSDEKIDEPEAKELSKRDAKQVHKVIDQDPEHDVVDSKPFEFIADLKQEPFDKFIDDFDAFYQN